MPEQKFHPQLRAARFLPRATVGPRSLPLVRLLTRLAPTDPRSNAAVVAVDDDRSSDRTDIDARRLRMWSRNSNRFGWSAYLGPAAGAVPPLAALHVVAGAYHGFDIVEAGAGVSRDFRNAQAAALGEILNCGG